MDDDDEFGDFGGFEVNYLFFFLEYMNFILKSLQTDSIYLCNVKMKIKSCIVFAVIIYD